MNYIESVVDWEQVMLVSQSLNKKKLVVIVAKLLNSAG